MSFDLNDCIKKCGDVDKDFRITAICDLTEELRKENFHMDSSSENKIVENILRLLQDSAKEVQDVAVKSLGPLVRKVSENHVTNIINTLAENIALTKRGKEEVREVSNSGLKAVLRDVDDKLGERVSNLLAPGLIKAIKSDSQDVVQECLDVVNDLLARFGSSTNAAHLQGIQDAVMPHLDSSRNLIRQRSIWVLTNVSQSCPEEAFESLSTHLIKKLGGDLKKQSTSIQLVGSIARSVGFRMGKHVGDFVPLLVNAVNKGDSDGDEEIKENAFQTFASFVESCPREIRPHIDTVLGLCLKYLSWDPNQLEDSSDEGDASGSDEFSGSDDEDGSDDSGMEASEDEDDSTWLVRRAAAKTIASLVAHHPERLTSVVEKAAPELVKRFKERESTARHEILEAYEAMALAVEDAGKSSAEYTAFSKTVGKAVTALAGLLSHKSSETRTVALSVLQSLGKSIPGSLGQHLKALIPGISSAIVDSNVQLKINGLDLLREILIGSPDEVQSQLEALFTPVQKMLSKSAGLNHKVATAALDACEAFLVAAAGKIEFLNKVYSSFEPLYKQTDLDSETKESAIRAAARAICNLGNKLPSLDAALAVLVERLGSDLSREAATVAIGTIADSGATVGDAWLSKAVPLLNSFCAPGARSLKIAALTALGNVYEQFGDSLKLHADTLKHVSELIDVDDFTLAQLATHVVTAAVHSNAKCVSDVKKLVYPRVQALLTSPLLEGMALVSIADFYREVAMLDTKGFGFAELSKDLEACFKGDVDVHAFRSVGACYAQVVANGDAKKGASTVASLVKQAGSKKENERVAAIYVLAEVGRIKDVSEYSGVVDALTSALDASERVVALAASYALGSVAVGNLSKYLPYILDNMSKNPQRQLLLLQAIKEIVSGQSSAGTNALRLSLSSSIGGTAAQDIAVHLDTLLPILFQHASSEDELTRNAVSECLGRLAKISPDRIVTEISKRGAEDKSAFARATMVHALRYAVTDRPSAEVDALLTKAYATAASAIGDSDIHVRLAGLQAVTWALQTKPRVVKEHLNVAMPAVYKETVIDNSLIKIIDLGNIKHITDSGLDKRTAAYELLYVILDTSFESVSIADYVEPLVNGMTDILTIKEAVYKIMKRLALVASGQVFSLLDKILPLLEKECKRPINKNDPQERTMVMKRSALSAVIALNTIPNASGHAKLQEVVNKSVMGGPFKEEYAELVKANK